jgi:PKD repeat protein
MRVIPRILLFISLLAVGLYSQAPRSAPAQQPNTVTIRPRRTSSPPGIPEVTAAADRTRIPVGDKVTFTLSPAKLVNDSCYQVTLFFGDGAQQVARQAQIVHIYQASGNYVYSILVQPTGKCTPTPTPTPLPDVPGVRLIVTPSSVNVNQSVTFVAELSRPSREFSYRFVFDDGSAAVWQRDPKATHAYAAAKTYQPYVEIGVPAGRAVRPVGGSKRQAVEVHASQPQLIIKVKLLVEPRATETRKPVKFTAQATASRPIGFRYRFDFGDGTPRKWQTAAGATHRYEAPGNYDARVDVEPLVPAAAQGATSDSISIAIAKPLEPTVDLNVVPASVPPGVPVFFSAVARGADSQPRYRFNFGDNRMSAWSSQPTQTHTYDSPREYRASVEMTTSRGSTVVSPEKLITIVPGFATPTPTVNPSPSSTPSASPTASPSASPTVSPSASPTVSPSALPTASITASPAGSVTRPIVGPSWLPNDWWPYLVLLLLLLLGGYKAVKYFLVPRPTFVPHVDAGKTKMASGLTLDYQVDVDPNVDGAFKIDAAGGNLIKAKRTSDD